MRMPLIHAQVRSITSTRAARQPFKQTCKHGGGAAVSHCFELQVKISCVHSCPSHCTATTGSPAELGKLFLAFNLAFNPGAHAATP